MAQHNWYNMKSVPLAAGAAAPAKIEMNIFDMIGGWGISASQFIGDFNNLMKTSGAKEADLYINSPGGSVFDGYAIMNTLNVAKKNGLVLNDKIIGIAASMASVMPSNSMMMIHNAITGSYGNADELRDTADILDKIDNSIVATYVTRTGKTEEDVRAMMAVETFMTAQEAMDGGFATAVTDAMKVSNKFDFDLLPDAAKVAYKAATQFRPKAAAAQPTKSTPKKPAKKPAPGQDPDQDPGDPNEDNEDESVSEDEKVGLAITDLAKNAGMAEFTAMFIIKASTLDEAETIINQAVTVKKLCATAKLPNEAVAFIKAGTPVAEVRTALLAKMSATDKSTPIKSVPNKSNKDSQSSGAAQPKAVRSTADIWAARKSLNKQGKE